MDPGYYPVGRQKWRVACPTGLCLFARLISWLIGIVKSCSSGTFQVLILKLRYLVICPEVFDGFNHFNHTKLKYCQKLCSCREERWQLVSFPFINGTRDFIGGLKN